MDEIRLKRYLVRRNTSDVYVWTEQLAKREGLEEVWAKDAKEALTKEAMPDPRRISLDQLENMSRADLIIFADAKLGMALPATDSKAALLDLVKQAVFSIPPESTLSTQSESRPYATVSDVKSAKTAGDTAKVEVSHAGNRTDKPVRA